MFEKLKAIEWEICIKKREFTCEEYRELVRELKEYFMRKYCEKSIIDLKKTIDFLQTDKYCEYNLLRLFFSGIFRKNIAVGDFSFFESLYGNFNRKTAYLMLKQIPILEAEKNYIMDILFSTDDALSFSRFLPLLFRSDLRDAEILRLNGSIKKHHPKNIRLFITYYIRWLNKKRAPRQHIDFSSFEQFYERNRYFFDEPMTSTLNHRFNIFNAIIDLHSATGRLSIKSIGAVIKNSEIMQNYLQDSKLYPQLMSSEISIRMTYYLVNRNQSIYMSYLNIFIGRALNTINSFSLKQSIFREYYYSLRILKPFIKKFRLNEYKIDYFDILQRVFKNLRLLLKIDRPCCRLLIGESIFFIKDLLFNSKMRTFIIKYLELFKNIFFYNMRAILNLLAKVSIEFNEQDIGLLLRLFEPVLLEVNIRELTFYEMTSITILLKNISYGRDLRTTRLHFFMKYISIFFRTAIEQRTIRKNSIKFLYGTLLLLNNQASFSCFYPEINLHIEDILFLIRLPSDRIKICILYYLNSTINSNRNKENILRNERFTRFLKNNKDDPIELAELKYNLFSIE